MSSYTLFKDEKYGMFSVITEVRTREKTKLLQESFGYDSHHSCGKEFKH